MHSYYHIGMRAGRASFDAARVPFEIANGMEDDATRFCLEADRNGSSRYVKSSQYVKGVKEKLTDIFMQSRLHSLRQTWSDAKTLRVVREHLRKETLFDDVFFEQWEAVSKGKAFNRDDRFLVLSALSVGRLPKYILGVNAMQGGPTGGIAASGLLYALCTGAYVVEERIKDIYDADLVLLRRVDNAIEKSKPSHHASWDEPPHYKEWLDEQETNRIETLTPDALYIVGSGKDDPPKSALTNVAHFLLAKHGLLANNGGIKAILWDGDAIGSGWTKAVEHFAETFENATKVTSACPMCDHFETGPKPNRRVFGHEAFCEALNRLCEALGV